MYKIDQAQSDEMRRQLPSMLRYAAYLESMPGNTSISTYLAESDRVKEKYFSTEKFVKDGLTLFSPFLLPLVFGLTKNGWGNGQSISQKLAGTRTVNLKDMQPCTIGKSIVLNILGEKKANTLEIDA